MSKIFSVEQGPLTEFPWSIVICSPNCRLFSKFTISTTTHQHVRIRSARLEGPKDASNELKIVGCVPQKRDIVVSSSILPAPGTDTSCRPLRRLNPLTFSFTSILQVVQVCIPIVQVMQPELIPGSTGTIGSSHRISNAP
jgi:hypothetical protein